MARKDFSHSVILSLPKGGRGEGLSEDLTSPSGLGLFPHLVIHMGSPD